MVSDPSPIFRRKACQDPIAESITQFGLFLHTAISPLLTEIDWTGCSLETNARKSVRLHSLQSAIETLKSQIPVVQRLAKLTERLGVSEARVYQLISGTARQLMLDNRLAAIALANAN